MVSKNGDVQEFIQIPSSNASSLASLLIENDTFCIAASIE